jgi:hypothetical protein
MVPKIMLEGGHAWVQLYSYTSATDSCRRERRLQADPAKFCSALRMRWPSHINLSPTFHSTAAR